MTYTGKYQHELEFAVNVARHASEILSSMQPSATVAVQKDIADIATTADLASEQYILDEIRKAFPTDGIHSEESHDTNTSSPRRWVVDPLDGTKEYAKGLAEYNVLIGLEENNTPVMGVIQRIGPDEVLTATIDGPALYNGTQIHVSKTDDLTRSFIGFHIPSSRNGPDAVQRAMNCVHRIVLSAYRIRPGWDTAQQCSWVARGILDAHIIPACVNSWHDVMEGLLLVERAGGTVTDYAGNPITAGNMENGFVISNGRIHDRLLALIQSSKEDVL